MNYFPNLYLCYHKCSYMCLFKRKQKEVIESKFHLGDRVAFKRKQDLMLGYIYKIYLSNGETYVGQRSAYKPRNLNFVEAKYDDKYY